MYSCRLEHGLLSHICADMLYICVQLLHRGAFGQTQPAPHHALPADARRVARHLGDGGALVDETGLHHYQAAATAPGTATPLGSRVQQHHTFQQKHADPAFSAVPSGLPLSDV
jgi:hypothetical protein